MNWFHFDNCIGLCFISQKRESDNKRIWQGKETIIVAINSTLEWWQHKEETALFFEKCNIVSGMGFEPIPKYVGQTPTISPAKRVPTAFRDKLKSE